MNHNSKMEAEIIACEKQFYTAMLTSDVSLLQQLVSDELVFVGPSGEIVTKQMDLELHRTGAMKVTKLEPKEQEILCMNDTAVAVTRIFLSGSFQGNPFAGDFRYTRVWHHTQKGWCIIAGHCNAIT